MGGYESQKNWLIWHGMTYNEITELLTSKKLFISIQNKIHQTKVTVVNILLWICIACKFVNIFFFCIVISQMHLKCSFSGKNSVILARI